MTRGRRGVLINPAVPAVPIPAPAPSANGIGESSCDTTTYHHHHLVRDFHRRLPGYAPTPLVSLGGVAAQMGVRAVFVKDEGSRLCLPSFKILGASWATYRAVSARVGLQPGRELEAVARAARDGGVVLFAATEGNHGRAVAAMAKMLGVRACIYVPSGVNAEDLKLIASEGAEVVISKSDYDGAMMEAYAASKELDVGLFVQDSSFEGYEEIPTWIVEGYSTLLLEAEQQVADKGLKTSLMVTPVGVGSLAHAVVSHCKGHGRDIAVVSVEPDTAPCLYRSLREGRLVSVQTSSTIMDGLNCGTVSYTAWDALRGGVSASVTVSDFEAHIAVQQLAAEGVQSGPCGASTLAALWRLAERNNTTNPQLLSADSVVVILSTEGKRTYKTPLDVSVDDPVGLTRILTTIDSSNPDLSNAAGAGETAICNYISSWLQHRDMEVHWLETSPGRPSVVGVLRGKGGGRSLMLNGHVDTVSLSSYSPSSDPLSGELTAEDGGRVHGRGSLDMKAGVAAAMAAMAKFREQAVQTGSPRLQGGVILAAVSDEENLSKGTEEILAAGWRADAAIITEPTGEELLVAHKGFVWIEIDVLGVAAHGSRPEEGVDAILLAGALQTALLEHAKTLPMDPFLGRATLHGGRIQGGEEASSYPALCRLTVEFRTIPGQTPESVLHGVERVLGEVTKTTPGFKAAPPRVVSSRPPFSIDEENQVVQSVSSAITRELGSTPLPAGGSFWCDAALLYETGIPAVVYGPRGEGLHAEEEWVSVESIRRVVAVLETVIEEFCR